MDNSVKSVPASDRCYGYRHRGFTLIELVITVSIIAVLAALVYPSYQHAIRKAKRTEARAALLQLMQQQERFYSLHTTYVQFSADATDVEAKQFKWYSGDNPASSTYEIQGKACADSTLTDCVLITATAGGSRVGKGYDDPECQVMSLTSNGAKLPVGEKCW